MQPKRDDSERNRTAHEDSGTNRRTILKQFSIGVGGLLGVSKSSAAKSSRIRNSHVDFESIQEQYSVGNQDELADIMEDRGYKILKQLTLPLKEIDAISVDQLNEVGIDSDWMEKALLEDVSLGKFANRKDISISYYKTNNTPTARLYITKDFGLFELTISVATEVKQNYAILKNPDNEKGLIIDESNSASTTSESSSNFTTSACIFDHACQTHDICDKDVCMVTCCTKCILTEIYCCEGYCYFGGYDMEQGPCSCPTCPCCEYYCSDACCHCC